ncbi:Formylmethionine deformylase [Artemisia annua]|uniref:Peptide deformylase n=1 Tax=Artemisia annua TaxID=35608 RepID=A0A2U1KAA9_ARTAN|nr:Formylmethionine deformylase [Artemisia annua]
MYNKLLYGAISSRGKEAVRRLSHRLSSKPLAAPFLQTRSVIRPQHEPILRTQFPLTKSAFNTDFIRNTRGFRTHSSSRTTEGWLAWLGRKKKTIALVIICLLALRYFTSGKSDLPSVVKAGDPVLHQPAREVYPGEIGSARIEKVIDDMVKVMRKELVVSLSAPQIGVPLRIIVLEYTKLYIALSSNKDNEEQDRRPFDLLVILNPKLKEKSNKTALFFEDCVSVDGHQAMVERFLEVEVTGLDQNGQPIKVDASGWQARILQHECDHLDGILYVDKMEKRTFRTYWNHKLPLAKGCPQQGVR